MDTAEAIAERWTMCMKEAGYGVVGFAMSVPEAPDGFVMGWSGWLPLDEATGRALHRARRLAGSGHRSCEDCYATWWASSKKLQPTCDNCPGGDGPMYYRPS